MKELSIEEKAKRYDEAIERANELYDEHERDIALLIFPELRESEDERIRLKLIEAVKGDMVVGGTKDKQLAIAWLEKQERKPILDVEIPFSAKDSELEEVFYSIPNGFHAEIEGNKVVIKKGEQKPAEWSKEDEKKLLCICAWIKDYPRIADFKDEIYTVANNYTDWLKSIKDRVQPQPMQWWSKDDEEMLDMCIDAATSTEHYSTSDIDSMESWLKSLRPQSAWKPSDEQINAIKDAIIMYEGRGINAVGLKGLLEQLKKLSEE